MCRVSSLFSLVLGTVYIADYVFSNDGALIFYACFDWFRLVGKAFNASVADDSATGDLHWAPAASGPRNFEYN